MDEELITIPKKEFDCLQDRSNKLPALEECGVDNWSSYGDAMKLFHSYDEDGD
jgi:hypothetical protein